MNGITYKSTEVKKLVDPVIDVGNLLLLDRDPLPELVHTKANKKENETKMLYFARDNVQLLFNEIWKLPRKNVDHMICAELPAGTYALPREKPLPEKRQLTKWEAFARAKGIVKHKKDRKVFDETTKDWKPRFGYQRASNDPVNKQWMVEIPRQKDPYVNYFDEQKQKKQNQADKYEYQRLKNVARGIKAPNNGANSTPLGGMRNVAPTTKLSAQAMKKQNKHESQQLTNQMYRAKTATASAGKFQSAIKGERKAHIGEKRKFAPNETNISSERQHQLDLFSKLQAKKPKLDTSKFNAVQQQKQHTDADDGENGDTGRRSLAGKNASKRRSAAGVHKHSASNKKRQEHYNAMKKGGKNFKSKGGHGR